MTPVYDERGTLRGYVQRVGDRRLWEIFDVRGQSHGTARTRAAAIQAARIL